MEKIKAKKLRRVNAETLIVTIDMGKTTPVGYCRCPDRTEVKPFEFTNNRAGFTKLWNCIVQTQAAKGLKEVVVGYESTGCYAEPLLHFLQNKPVRLIQVNPLHTKRLKELQGNSPHKTDQKDPKVIADIIELGHGLTVVIPKGAAAELRRLTQARERELKRRTALYNQLQDLVFLCFPELLQIMKNVKTKTTQYLLQHYPTPVLLLAQGVESLAFTLRRISKGKLGLERAKALSAAAGHSVGITDGLIGLNLEIQAILAAITVSDTYITSLEHEMRHHLEQIPYSPLLLSIKGLGLVTVAGLIGEVGDFTKFHSQKEVLKLAGLDLFEISSGKHKGQRRISKRGRSLMRKLLFFAAMNTVRTGGIMHQQYQQYLQNGMKKIKALVAIARKLLGIMFALVRTQSEYYENYQKAPAEAEPQLLLAA